MISFPVPALCRLHARRAATAAAVVLFGACASPAAPPDSPAGGLAAGDEVSPAGNGVFFVSFLEVLSDSRCPTRVKCVWEGDATVRFGYRFGRGATVPFVLQLNTAPRDTLIDRVRVVFDSLTPTLEVPGAPIPAARYRAWVSLKPLP
ncbi:hypothetical protein [Gemmatimonas phototrophica]|uniref:Lipoprotein n=1 Tax=Gemmatimonas phototrophica TaxID=1379270 RepID=A0A143BHE6_9BACT|nr:hypothetical protein [Gemmatimonas phototrophica]AMW04467.1 hypothetical protein GEMMAAP_05665 [Gemmatimonas phototrophica]